MQSSHWGMMEDELLGGNVFNYLADKDQVSEG